MANKKILVIDDDRKFLKVLEDGLTTRGFDVILAANGNRGIHLFKSMSPDLILVDVLLPQLDGFQVCEKIRQEPQGKDIPIIMMTAIYKMPDKERQARTKYQVKAYMHKPIRLDQLYQEIDQALK